jgi:3-oxoacyl-[acyl-carrier protein] reductase
MDLGLRSRVAIVAASSRGLGRAIAEGLAAEGVHLALCSRSPEQIEQVGAAIAAAHGVKVIAHAVDVSQPTQVEAFVAATWREFGRIDICVTNAGGPPAKPFLQTTLDEWRHAAELNLLSHVSFARTVLPHMQQARWGRFLMISSVAVRQPVEGLVLSNTVRGGVPGLTRSLANEFGKDNILVNNVCPGYTRTERLEELARFRAELSGTAREEAMQDWSRQTVLGRVGEPREFADTVVFLASERASYITGQNIVIDGGLYRGI